MHESKLPPPKQIFQVDHYQFFTQELDARPRTTPLDHLDFISDPQGLLSPEEIDELNARHSRFQEHSRHINSALSQRQLDRFVIEFCWKSAHLEGNTYTLPDTEHLFRHGKEADGHSSEEAVMVRNHKQAIETVLAHRDLFVTLQHADILEVHRMLVADLSSSNALPEKLPHAAGSTHISHSVEPQYKDALDALLGALNKLDFVITAINSARHPAEKALRASLLLPAVHAFIRGNECTGRLIANALLLANDWPPLSYRSVGSIKYKQALSEFTRSHSPDVFKRLFMAELHSKLTFL